MKILIYGAGVVGCTYGWQLSKAGCDVAVLVRKEQKELVQKDGIRIICSDFREKTRKDTDIIFKPTVIDELSSNNDFEYIIVSTNKLQLSTILPSLSKSAGKANVVFFQNNWNVFTEIDKYLKPEQYFFAFPFMVGGGKEDKSIHCAISGLKYSNTPLGEKDGRITPQVEKLFIILDKANLKPVISNQILVWLITHYAVAAGLSAGIMSLPKLMEFIRQNIKYPQSALQSKLEGRVIVQVVIDKDGSVIQPKILRSINPVLSIDNAFCEEVLRIISIMPKWKPGSQHEIPVKVKFTFPVRFTLPTD
ncbi:TonB family protein [Bacteroides intestinalis]|uniref:TonB family protein n=1 Tax=Bacteroides intestinalis TaxID=329854 RepID=UPI00216AB3EF|nr:TonB family protein [Bacteroides intestinalis]